MKYVITRENGVTEIREDSYSLQNDAFVLTNEQYEQLMSENFVFQNGQIVVNPNKLGS